jgi:hypothetical protein
MVLETSVLSTFNHLTRLEARENFINFSRRESLKSYIVLLVCDSYSLIQEGNHRITAFANKVLRKTFLSE